MKCFRIIYLNLKYTQLLGNWDLRLQMWLSLDLHAFRVRMWRSDLLLRVDNLHVIRQRQLRSTLTGYVMIQHDLNLNAKHTLTQQHMAYSNIDVIVFGLTRVDHPTIDKLHALSTLATELATDNNFASFGARLHDETKYTITSTTHSQATDKFVA